MLNWVTHKMRHESSDVEEVLAAELADAALDSSGKFTLSPQEALKKLGAYQLPGKYIWACKVVQAGVAGGASYLKIRKVGRHLEFRWDGKLPTAECADTLFDPGPGESRAWWHLKQGLWNLALQANLPFLLQGGGWSEAVHWSNQRSTRKECKPGQENVLLVYSLGLAGLREVRRELARRAFACPLRLEIGKLRLDNLQIWPGQGLNDDCLPLRLSFLSDPALPHLQPAPGSLEKCPTGLWARSSRKPARFRYLTQVLELPAELPPEFSAACLVTAHIRQPRFTEVSERDYFVSFKRESQVMWLLDGVVVDRQPLPIPQDTCSAGLLLSAEGLTLDLSGFSLQRDPLYQSRLALGCSLARPEIRKARPNFQAYFEHRKKSVSTTLTWLSGIAGLGLIPAGPFGWLAGGLILGGSMLAIKHSSGSDLKDFPDILPGLKNLQDHW